MVTSDRVDYLNDLDVPWYILLDSIDDCCVKKRKQTIKKIFDLV